MFMLCLITFVGAYIGGKFILYRIVHEYSCLIEFIKRVGEKEIKCEACRAFYRFFATSLVNSIMQEQEC